MIRFFTSLLFLLLTQIVVSQSESIAEVKKVFLDKTQHDTIRVEAAIQLADNIYNSDLDSAFRLIERAHYLSKKHNYKKGLSITSGYLGFIYHTKGDYQNGIKAYQSSIAYNRKNNFELNLAMDLGNYGSLLSELKDAKAIRFFKESIEIYKKKQKADDIAYLYSYIGSNFSKSNVHDSAIYYYKLGLSYVTVPDTKANITRQLSESYFSKGDASKALEVIKRAEGMIVEENNKAGLKLILITKANICISSNRLEEAQASMKELESLQDVEINRNGELLYNELKARLYYQLGDYEKAYSSLFSVYNQRDDIYNEELIYLVKRKSIEFEYQQKTTRDSISLAEEREIRDLKFETKLKEEANNQKILWGSVLSLLLIVGLITRSYLKNRKNTRIIEEQNEALELKNKEIIDSINYAKRIQTVILPSMEEMKNAFPHSFVYNRPKSIIGGDFYWLFKKDNLHFLAVADCTGHGVPGALLSVICSEALNRSVGEFKLEDPASILNKVRELVKDHLMHTNEKLYDGMDISLVSLRRSTADLADNELCFAGANSSILVKTSDGIEIVRGDRQPIGKYINESSFQNFRMKLKNEDMVFMASDGYLDQFGGPKGKKMKMTPFLTFLKSINNDSISSYESEIVAHFENWKGQEEQVDDVCFVAFQVK